MSAATLFARNIFKKAVAKALYKIECKRFISHARSIKTESTTQMESEAKQKQEFGGLYTITKEFGSHENKKYNTDSDVTIDFHGEEKTVSLKTVGGAKAGNFNGGAGHRACSKWMNSQELELIKKAEKDVRYRRSSILKEYTRWKDIEDENIRNNKKYWVIEPFYNTWYDILSNDVDAVHRLQRYLSGRKSDLLYVGDQFEKYPSFRGEVVSKINSKSIMVGNYELRFKSEGGKVTSSIKVNGTFKG